MPLNLEYLMQIKEEAAAKAAAESRQAEAAPPDPSPPPPSARQIVEIPIALLRDFPPELHHFHPASPERLEELRQSIVKNGILSPLLIRPMEDGTYQIMAGHNRRTAARLAGYEKVDCIVRETESIDEAREIMLEDNLRQRTDLLPSERAWAYHDLMALRRKQGFRSDLTCGHRDHNFEKTRDSLTEDASGRSVSRYIRLVKLIPDLLDKVDAKALSVVIGEQLSFLGHRSQQTVYTYFFVDNTKKKLDKAMAGQLREIESDPDQVLDTEAIDRLVAGRENNRAFRTVKIPMKNIRKYFHVGATREEVEEVIEKAIQFYFEGRENSASEKNAE